MRGASAGCGGGVDVVELCVREDAARVFVERIVQLVTNVCVAKKEVALRGQPYIEHARKAILCFQGKKGIGRLVSHPVAAKLYCVFCLFACDFL
eukprot:m.356012 g.356012  ORF g.356012 m.356012 type:complete len:94 (-) comp17419_c0_seq1:356-637(-)